MAKWPNSTARPLDPKETHLRNLKQVTFGGQNAEAYWDLKGKNLIFQSTQPGYPDEQIFTMSGDGANRKLVSTGKGRCTCSYFSPDGKTLLFASSHSDPQIDITELKAREEAAKGGRRRYQGCRTSGPFWVM